MPSISYTLLDFYNEPFMDKTVLDAFKISGTGRKVFMIFRYLDDIEDGIDDLYCDMTLDFDDENVLNKLKMQNFNDIVVNLIYFNYNNQTVNMYDYKYSLKHQYNINKFISYLKKLTT